MKSKKPLTAQKFRVLLVLSLFLIVAAAGGGFYYAQNTLRSYATEISTTNSKAAQSETNINVLRKIKEYLATHSDEQNRASQIVAESKQYQYQNQIVDDISRFAAQSGISITSYTFSEEAAAVATPAAPSSPGTSTTAPAATPTGLKSKKISIKTTSPVDYVQLLDFIHRIEQNTTKMQISTVSMSKSTGENPNQVTADGFDIVVYVR